MCHWMYLLCHALRHKSRDPPSASTLSSPVYPLRGSREHYARVCAPRAHLRYSPYVRNQAGKPEFNWRFTELGTWKLSTLSLMGNPYVGTGIAWGWVKLSFRLVGLKWLITFHFSRTQNTRKRVKQEKRTHKGAQEHKYMRMVVALQVFFCICFLWVVRCAT